MTDTNCCRHRRTRPSQNIILIVRRQCRRGRFRHVAFLEGIDLLNIVPHRCCGLAMPFGRRRISCRCAPLSRAERGAGRRHNQCQDRHEADDLGKKTLPAGVCGSIHLGHFYATPPPFARQLACRAGHFQTKQPFNCRSRASPCPPRLFRQTSDTRK
jgi:hypothetical protein